MAPESSPEHAFGDIRVRIRQLVELVTSRSPRTPPALRLEAARRLLEVRKTVDDYLEIIHLREDYPDGDSGA